MPKLCDHSLLRNSSRHTRPCSLSESYVSSGRDLTLEHVLRQGSALYPISFELRYEFVHEAISCDQLFTSSSTPSFSASVSLSNSGSGPSHTTKIGGTFASPKSVFFFGRGGAQNLSCVYRFEAEADQKIELTIVKASFGDKQCNSYMDPLADRWTCDRSRRNARKAGEAGLRVSEYPWHGVELLRDCICSAPSDKVVLKTLTSNVVELKFFVTRMNVTQDYEDYYFEGEYRFLPLNDQTSECTTKLEDRKLRGPSGEITFGSPLPQVIAGVAAVEEITVNTEDVIATHCVNEPWLIEPDDSRMNFLYLRTNGYLITMDNVAECESANRIVVYSASRTGERNVICPLPLTDNSRTVDFFSGGWNLTGSNSSVIADSMTQHARSFVIEFLEREAGFYAVSWMAISKSATSSSLGSSLVALVPIEECPYR